MTHVKDVPPMSRKTHNAAAAITPAVHATHPPAGERNPTTGALTLSPGGREPAPHPRVIPPPAPGPPNVGGGIGWEVTAEHRTLKALGDAVGRGAGDRPVRLAIRDGLIGPWPWLHIAPRDNPRVALGVISVTGQAWVYQGPHVPAAQSGPVILGTFPGSDDGHDALAGMILTGLYCGAWPVPARRPDLFGPAAGPLAALLALSTDAFCE